MQLMNRVLRWFGYEMIRPQEEQKEQEVIDCKFVGGIADGATYVIGIDHALTQIRVPYQKPYELSCDGMTLDIPISTVAYKADHIVYRPVKES